MLRVVTPVTVMLVDSASLYFRAFFGVPESVTAPDGMPVNAVRGFVDMIAQLITRRRPSRFVACLDLDWRPAFRVELVPSYKAHRVAPAGGETIPDALSPQVPVLLDVLAAAGLATAGAEGFEADDVIATLAARDADTVEIVSGDRDLMALVTDTVTLLYTGRGVAKLEELRPDDVLAKYGVPAPRYPDFAVLRGDPSDGLPGVKGIGEKAAAALVSRYGAHRGHRRGGSRRGGGLPGRRPREGAGRSGLPRGGAGRRPRSYRLRDRYGRGRAAGRAEGPGTARRVGGPVRPGQLRQPAAHRAGSAALRLSR